MLGYYIGGYLLMVAIFSGMVSAHAFYLFAGIGAIACVLQWVMS